MSKFETFDLFATPVQVHKNVYSCTKAQFDFVKNLKFNKENNLNVFVTKPNFKILEEPIFNELSNIIDNKVHNYLKDTLNINDKIHKTFSWSTYQTKGDQHHSHAHRGSFISCVFYMKAESGDFILYKQKSSLEEGYFLDYDINSYNSYNSSYFTFFNRTSDLIIFPGWVAHKTTPTDSERITIAANYFLKGSIGFEKNMTTINLN